MDSLNRPMGLPVRPQALQRFKILIVDDEPLIRKLVRDVLKNLGFIDVTEMTSGRRAIEILGEKTFDFIITDWRMGDLDGIDIVRFVRGRQSNTPIIMLTGNTEVSYVRSAIDAGINAYLIKPFTVDQLVKRIASVIDSPRDFVISKNYTGPDRRCVDRPPPDGIERRKKKK